MVNINVQKVETVTSLNITISLNIEDVNNYINILEISRSEIVRRLGHLGDFDGDLIVKLRNQLILIDKLLKELTK